MPEAPGAEREKELAERARLNERGGTFQLIHELTYDRGASWQTIADLNNVTVATVRKWRFPGSIITQEQHAALARFASLLDMIEERGLEDPVAWVESNLTFDEPGYFLWPITLYLDGHLDALFDLAEGQQSVEPILDQIKPGWRDGRSNYETFVDIDGQLSIRSIDRGPTT